MTDELLSRTCTYNRCFVAFVIIALRDASQWGVVEPLRAFDMTQNGVVLAVHPWRVSRHDPDATTKSLVASYGLVRRASNYANAFCIWIPAQIVNL